MEREGILAFFRYLGPHRQIYRVVTESETLGRWGRLDILVNNAGLGTYGHFHESSEEEWRDLFEIKYWGGR